MQPRADYAISQDKGVMDTVLTGLDKCATARGRLSVVQQSVS